MHPQNSFWRRLLGVNYREGRDENYDNEGLKRNNNNNNIIKHKKRATHNCMGWKMEKNQREDCDKSKKWEER